MSLIYRIRGKQTSFTHGFYDYLGEMRPFAQRIEKKRYWLILIFLKSIEWSIYRWYKTPIRRFYGVKGNELIYMITNRCNDRCPKCGIWERPESNSDHLQVTYFLECLRRLHKNLYQVTITGGEPLLFKNDVLAIGEEAKRLNVPMLIVSNARFLNEEFLSKYAEQGHILVISVDAVEKEKWNEFRGRKNFEIGMRNILLAKKMLGNKLRIQSVLSDETKDEIPKVIEFCREHGIPHINQTIQDFGGKWRVNEKLHVIDETTPCAARKNICVYPNGDVVKCFDHRRIPLAKEPLGNIAQEDIISILCKRRSTEISKLMKTCNFPCKNMSCNKPPELVRR